MKLVLIVSIVLLNVVFVNPICEAQPGTSNRTNNDSTPGQTFTMAAGSRFAASPWKEFWWGKHWRDEWLAPVTFQVFNFDTTAGGLTPLKKGGGHETKTLRLAGKDGREYVLRTMDKSLDVLIPEQFKGSFVNDLVNDQISTAHPYGPLVIAHLSGSIGILHTNPVIIYVPDNPKLGEFRNDFANKLCLFEERPNGDGWEHTSLTGFADDILNSEKLFSKLQADNDKTIDQKEFLKIRLFDMLVNDWDRHEDQWVWAGKKTEGKTTYVAFARDRDQSFSKTDGVNLYFASRPWALRSIQNMNATVTDVIGSNLSATSLDKVLLNALSETDWHNTIESLQSLLTDSVILEALHQMPDAIYSLSGDFLYRRLRSRRDDMMEFGMKYYRILGKEVAIMGTDKRELFIINRAGDRTTEITVQAMAKKSNPGDTIYHRIFNHDVTREINLYGNDGDDEFIYTGNTNNQILVRILGGDGNDLFIDSLNHDHHMAKVPVYDGPGNAPSSSRAFHFHATSDTSITKYDREAFKYDWWMPLIFPGYNPDDGVLIGAAFTYKKQKWHKNPFGWQQTVGGNYAFATGAYSLSYKGTFKQTFGQWDLDLKANYKAPTYVINFYGFGNDSKLSVKNKSFYRVRATSFLFNPAVSRSWKKNMFDAGLIFNTIKVESSDDKFLNQVIPIVGSSVFQTKYFGGAYASCLFNTSNNFKYPTKGINYYAGVSYMMNLKETKRDFVNLQSNFTFYFSPVKGITLAHRTGTSVNAGDYEFYQASTLGGSENLRGYWRTRFTGKTSFYQNTDIRWKVADLRGYIVRGTFGIYGFFDDGRVWQKEEHSNVLHTGYGGGIFFIPYNTLAINLSLASSKEVNVFTFRTGFLF